MENLNFLSKAFLWLAGVDKTYIHACPSFEILKLEAFGVTVLIPAILSFVSMAYLLPLYVTYDVELIWLLAFLWALIILSIDRALILGINKFDLKLGPIFFRFILSIVLGFVISHPLVIYIFEDQINDQINIEKYKDYHQNPHISELKEHIKKQEAHRDVKESNILSYRSLSNSEQLGLKKCVEIAHYNSNNTTECSSGTFSCGEKCKRFKGRYIESNKHREEINKNIEYSRKVLLESENKKEEYIKSQNDISVKTHALYKILTESGDILFVVEFFSILILLMTIDIIAVVIKLSSGIDTYDRLVEKARNNWRYSDSVNKYNSFQYLLFEKIIKYKEDRIKNPALPLQPYESEKKIKIASSLGIPMFFGILFVGGSDAVLDYANSVNPIFEFIKHICTYLRFCK